MKALLKRVRVRLTPLVLVLAPVRGVLLDQLGVVDLKPLLAHYLGDQWAVILAPVLAGLLAQLKPALHLEPKAD